MEKLIYVIFMCIFSLYASSQTPKALSLDRIEEIINRENITDLEQFLEFIDPAQKRIVSLMLNSKSPQSASLKYPRVIFQPSSDIYMAFSTDPNDQKYQILEIIEYNEDANDYEFHTISFDDRGRGLTTRIKDIFSNVDKYPPKIVRNEKSCKSCHRVGPLWDGYAFWSGSIGSYHQPRKSRSIIAESNSIRDYEQKFWNKNVKKYKKTKRLRHMNGAFQSNNPLDDHQNYVDITVRDLEHNNLKITTNIVKQYAQILSNRVSEQLIEREDLMLAFNYLISYESIYSINRDDFLDLLPEHLRNKFNDEYTERVSEIESSIEKHLNLSIKEQSKIHNLNPSDFYPNIVNELSFDTQNNSASYYAMLDFLLSDIDIELANFSPARRIGKRNYLFNDGGSKPWGNFFKHLKANVDDKLSYASEHWRNISKTSTSYSYRNKLNCQDAIKSIIN